MKINCKTLIGFVFIYFLLVMCNSYLYINFVADFNLLILAGMGGYALIKRKYHSQYVWGMILFLLGSVTFVRLISGGIGLMVWTSWSVMVAVTFYAVKFDKEKFLERFVQMVVFLALISIFGFILQQVAPSILKSILIAHYPTGFAWSDWSDGFQNTGSWYADGILLYVVREGEETRNIGIFSEPGVYQLVLNSAIYSIWFLSAYLKFSKPQKIKYLAILLAALITTQSTTGYLALFAMLLCYLLSRGQSGEKNIKRNILSVLLFFIIILFCDSMVRGEDNFFVTAVQNKLCDGQGYSLAASSGTYRWGAIIACFSLMMEMPWGAGWDNVAAAIDRDTTGNAGGALFVSGATIGVIPWLIILVWMFYPLFKSNLSWGARLSYIFLFVLSTLSESTIFYPALLCIPMFLYLKNKEKILMRKSPPMKDYSQEIKQT